MLQGVLPPRPMADTLRALSALLRYPEPELLGHAGEIAAALRAEAALPAPRLAAVLEVVAALAAADPLEAETDYVACFDHGRATSLHLFEHVHAESRDRGTAMVDLRATYAEAGLEMVDGELPDYLPAVLEYASTQPPRQARAFLAEIAHIVASIDAALLHRGSPYAAVSAAILELAGAPRARDAAAGAVEDEPLDESWAEPPAFDGCSQRGQAGAAQPVRVHRRIPSQPGASS